jgi:hypothetical protein
METAAQQNSNAIETAVSALGFANPQKGGGVNAVTLNGIADQ